MTSQTSATVTFEVRPTIPLHKGRFAQEQGDMMVGSRLVHQGWLLALFMVVRGPVAGHAATIQVDSGESIQAAIGAATDGDIVLVAAGTFDEDIDFLGKAIAVVGTGHESVIRGTGAGPVVTLATAEGPDSVLDSFTITGGLADRGGGIFVRDSSPTIVRNVVFLNQARLQGSGIYVEGSSARIYNNLVVYNHTAGGDPHSIEVVNAGPEIINNTIVRNDSNGIILQGSSPAIVMNNVIALNGSRGRGRGICDFSIGDVARVQYNVFSRNRIAALLTDGRDFRRIRRAQGLIDPPRLEGNLDGRPNFVQRRLPPGLGSRRMLETPLASVVTGLGLSTEVNRRRGTDAGNPDPMFNDLDGTRNDMGFTGGPFAATD